MIGSKILRILGDQPIASPKINPGTPPIRHPIKSRNKVIPKCGKSFPLEIKEIRVMIIFDGGGKNITEIHPDLANNSQTPSVVSTRAREAYFS
jgi:hypothetical protein